MEKNNTMSLKVPSSIRLLSRQWLAPRGHDDDGDGNQIQALRLMVEESAEIREWLEKKWNKYTSPDIQNDLIKIMALNISRIISNLLQKSPFLSIIINEMTDITDQEQVAIVMRTTAANFEICEEFWGLYGTSSIDAASVFAVNEDTMLRFNLPMSKLQVQCYDGRSTMNIFHSGVATRVQDVELRPVSLPAIATV